jgi:hypothetical protein
MIGQSGRVNFHRTQERRSFAGDSESSEPWRVCVSSDGRGLTKVGRHQPASACLAGWGKCCRRRGPAVSRWSLDRRPKERRAQCAGAIAVRWEGQSTGLGARDCFVAKGVTPARVSEAWIRHSDRSRVCRWTAAQATLAIQMSADAEGSRSNASPGPDTLRALVFAAEKAEGTITDRYRAEAQALTTDSQELG